MSPTDPTLRPLPRPLHRKWQHQIPQRQACLDACLCLLVAMTFADSKPCLVVGQQESGAIVVPHSKSLAEELRIRCRQTGRDPKEWVNKFP